MDFETGSGQLLPQDVANPLAPGPVSKQFIQNFFLQKGVPPQVAAGWAQRLMYESAGGNPLAVNPTSGALGLAQDLGPRKQNLLAQPNWQDPTVQLENLWREMHGGDPISTSAFSRMMAADTASDAYKLFTHFVERPGAAGGDVMAAAGTAGATHAGSSAEPLPSEIFHPLGAGAPPGEIAPVINVNFPTMQAPQQQRVNPMQILQMIAAITGRTHSFQPVDYDPWAVVPRLGNV